MPKKEAERTFDFLLEKYAERGLMNPELAVRHDISEKMRSGKTREQAMDELCQENIVGADVKDVIEKQEEVTVETLQKIVDDEKEKLSSLSYRFESLQEETAYDKRNFKIMTVSCIILFLILGGLFAAYFPRTTKSTAQTKTGHELQTFSGLTDETTSVVNIPGESWRITWGVQSDYPEYALFGLFVFPEGETSDFIFTRQLTPPDSEMGLGEYYTEQVGIEYLTGIGSYYIEVISSIDWFITVESYN